MIIYYLYVKTHNITGLKYLGFTKKSNPYAYKGSGTQWKAHLNEHGLDYSTSILKICYSMKSVEAWGLFYSNLWSVTRSNKWANIKPESGDGGDTKSGTVAWNNGRENKYSSTRPGPEWEKGLLIEKLSWYNNGTEERKLNFCPSGWTPGRLKGKKAWNNGYITKRSYECPGPEWKLGRLVTEAMHRSAKEQSGYATLFDREGNKVRVRVGDDRHLSGDLRSANKGRDTFIDVDTGNEYRLDISDPLVSQMNLVSIRTIQKAGKAILYDSFGNKIITTKNDSRLKTGELSGNRSQKTNNYQYYRNKQNK